MKLIQNWRESWRMFSAQALAVLAVLPLVWVELPDELKVFIPTEWLPYIVAAVAFAGFIGRITKQPKLDK